MAKTDKRAELNQLIDSLGLSQETFVKLHTLIAAVRIGDVMQGEGKSSDSYFYSKAGKICRDMNEKTGQNLNQHELW